jgi:hypothetical protein
MPARWHRSVLPGGRAVLAYPPAMHLVTCDRGTVTAAQTSAPGSYLLYLNASPHQGAESLQNWPRFRVNHLLDEDASAVRLLAASGTRPCLRRACSGRTAGPGRPPQPSSGRAAGPLPSKRRTWSAPPHGVQLYPANDDQPGAYRDHGNPHGRCPDARDEHGGGRP